MIFNKNKVLSRYLLLFIIFLISIGSIFYTKQTLNQQLTVQNKNLVKSIDVLNSENENLKEEILITKKRIEELEGKMINEIKDCNFTKTFKIIDVLEYSVDEKNIFVVLDQFQMFSPFILKIPNKYAEIIKVNENYEFHFKGNSSNSDNLNEYVVANIIKSKYFGFDQIQENCN